MQQLPSLDASLHLFLILGVLLLLTACSDDSITIKKMCSKNDTYCEDLAKIPNSTVYENMTSFTDSRSPDNQSYYENIQ